MSKFIVQYPGKFIDIGTDDVNKYIEENEAIKLRGPVNTELIKKKCIPQNYPGYDGCITLTEEFAKYQSDKYDPDNRVYTDLDYAKSLGYDGLPVYFTVGMFYAIKPFPFASRDYFTPCNINHTNTLIKPFYVGDTVHCFIDENSFMDITPLEGSELRSVALVCKGSAYNQNGELCMTFTFNLVEHLKVLSDREAAKDVGFGWDAPDWWKRPDHYYTDEDWQFIKEVWAKEAQRGDEPLWWDDVNIGDEPAWTLEGPIDKSVDSVMQNGLGIGGARTLKKEIMNPEIFKTMIRNPYDGIYRLQKRSDSFPIPPEWSIPKSRPFGIDNDDPSSEPPHRNHFINYICRDMMFRHIHAWFGDRALITELRWGIMSPDSLEEHGWNVPRHPNYKDLHLEISPIKENKLTTHGLERDIALIKSYVYDKYSKNGSFYVELGWWVETITGEIYQEGQATIKLPAKNQVYRVDIS